MIAQPIEQMRAPETIRTTEAATVALRARREELLAEVAKIERRLDVIATHQPVRAQPVSKRIRVFLQANPNMTFGARELMEAVAAREESVRKALTTLIGGGFLVRTARGTYQIDPTQSPVDHDSAVIMRGWEG